MHPLNPALSRVVASYRTAGDVLVTTAYLVVVLGVDILGALVNSDSIARVGLVGYLVLGVIVLVRRAAPIAGLAAALAVPVLARLADSGLARDPSAAEILTSQQQVDLLTLANAMGVRVDAIELLSLGILMCTVAYLHASRTTWVVAAATVPVLIAITAVFGGYGQQTIMVAQSLGVVLLATLVGINLRTRALRIGDLEEGTRRLTLERDQREQIAVSAERGRIAREMHDMLAHSLSVMVSLADGAALTLERDPALARDALEELSSTGRSALKDTRRLVGVLREGGTRGDDDQAMLAPQPSTIDLAELVERFTKAGIPVTMTTTGDPASADSTLNLTIYRIVQESLTNVLRYAPGTTRAAVELDYSPDIVSVTIENDGAPGVAYSEGGGRGLIGIRERAAVFDGQVSAGPTADGWRVHATLKVGANRR